MKFWLSRTIFDWLAVTGGGRLVDITRGRRPHEILAHSERVLITGASEFSVADSILGLKRAINSRLQHLEELYHFGDLFPKGFGSLERLEQMGLARPLVVKQLFEIRNDIEHNDAAPPTFLRAQELVDATWYFLRATDYACKLVPHSLTLRSGEEGTFPPAQCVSLQASREHAGQFEISGWVSIELLAETEQLGFFEFDLLEIKSKPTTPPDFSGGRIDDLLLMSAYAQNTARGDDERSIFGQATLPLDLQRDYWRLALDAL